MADDAWGLAEAKAKLSELMERTRTAGPQHITRNGKPMAVLVSAEEWARRTRPRENLADFLARSPLRESGVEFERDDGGMRDVDL